MTTYRGIENMKWLIKVLEVLFALALAGGVSAGIALILVFVV